MRLVRGLSVFAVVSQCFPVEEKRVVPVEVFRLLQQSANWIAPAYCSPNKLTYPFDCAACAQAGDLKLVKAFSTETWTHVIGYLAVDEEKRIAVLSLRGTDLLSTNVLSDLMLVQTMYEQEECKECFVHLGFYRAWKQALEDIGGMVKEVLDQTGYEFYIVGHSFGGAIATFAGVHFYDAGYVPVVVTMGAPRIGNQNFADYVDERLGERFYRVTIDFDPVPLVPPVNFGYRHCGQEIFITNETLPLKRGNMIRCFGQEDEKCSVGSQFVLWEVVRVGVLIMNVY